ncbi:uncharacterized protein LOC115216627 [Argonauta hians]
MLQQRIFAFSGRTLISLTYSSLLLLFILLTQAEVVMAVSTTVKVAITSALAMLMLLILLILIVLGITCNKWYDKYQTRLGRGKIPNISSFWKKRKTVSSVESIRSKDPLSTYNSVIIPSPNARDSDTDTWIKKWAHDTKHYEEMTKEMELGDEEVDMQTREQSQIRDVVIQDSTSPSVKTSEESLPSSYASIVKRKEYGSSEDTDKTEQETEIEVL